MSNQPVYRRPRSHAYSCRCSRCVQSMPDNSAPAAFWGAMLFLAVAFWPEYALHGRASVIAGIAWWGSIATIGVTILVAYLNAQRVRAPKGRLPVEVLPDGPVPLPPPCYHLNAVKVNSGVPGLHLTWRCWCPDCEGNLPAVFRYPCCGGEPGTLPGYGHAYNCPHGEPKQAAR